MTTFLERLEKACTHAGITPGRGRQAELARRLSKHLGRPEDHPITRSSVGVWFKSKKKDVAVDPLMMMALHEVLDVNICWLISGPPYSMERARKLSSRQTDLLQIGDELRRLRPDLYESWVADARVRLELLHGSVAK